MAGNTFGRIFRLSSFGESHGPALGGVIDGVPGGLELDLEAIQHDLDRRRPGQSKLVTQRKEGDKLKFLSGVFEGRTTGTSIGFIIENENQKSKDYSHIAEKFRPSHADYTYQKKYGHRDYRGGGRSSARETVARIVAGGIAKQMLPKLKFTAFVSSVGDLALHEDYKRYDLALAEENDVRCPDPLVAEKMATRIMEVRKEGDTIGGTVSCVIRHVPVGLGEPIFDRLEADLAKAMLSLPAVKGFEIGSGFKGTQLKGSEHNDVFLPDGSTVSNNSGGVQGGISNGMDIYFKVAFKPVATIMKDQSSIDLEHNEVTVSGKGRHDPCVVPRAVPIVEAMAAMVIADHFLLQSSRQNEAW